MARPRKNSVASETSVPDSTQELGSMYDYLAKVILLGPSGAGKSVPYQRTTLQFSNHQSSDPKSIANQSTSRPSRSCLLHRFLKNEWRILSSQTIGVEFASKIIKVGTGARRKRIKLQLWDTAGTERFRSVSRSYYRGAAGAILVYDVASLASFGALPTFLMDAQALGSRDLTVLLAGNKRDLTTAGNTNTNSTANAVAIKGSGSGSAHRHAVPDDDANSLRPLETPSSISSKQSSFPFDAGGSSTPSQPSSLRSPSGSTTLGSKQTATTAPEGREVSPETASRWASQSHIPVCVEVSALSGENVDELFARLARIILTKIELGEIDPDDPQSGIQYGDASAWMAAEMGSVKSSAMGEDESVRRRRERGRSGGTGKVKGTWRGGWREWEDVFRISGSTGSGGRRRGGGCC